MDDLLRPPSRRNSGSARSTDEMAGPLREAGSTVDLTPVADRIVATIPRKLQIKHPDAALRIQEGAEVYRQRFSLEDAEALLRETNAELESFYAKYPGSQRAALAADPEVARLAAEAEALRTAIYTTLDAPGQGAAAREAAAALRGTAECRTGSLSPHECRRPPAAGEFVGAVDQGAGGGRVHARGLQNDARPAAARHGGYCGRQGVAGHRPRFYEGAANDQRADPAGVCRLSGRADPGPDAVASAAGATRLRHRRHRSRSARARCGHRDHVAGTRRYAPRAAPRRRRGGSRGGGSKDGLPR